MEGAWGDEPGTTNNELFGGREKRKVGDMKTGRVAKSVAMAALWLWAAAGTGAASEAGRRILAGDRLNISVKEQPDISRVYAVAGDGSIDFAFAGRVVIAEMTEDEAEQKLEAVLEKDYFREAHVSISIANFVEGDILVHGEVANPGVLSFRGDSILTLMEAVLRSGGLTDRAAADRVQIIRWLPGGRMEREVVVVNLQEIMDGAFEKDQYLRPRDTVMVPRRGVGDGEENPEFLALGEVVRSVPVGFGRDQGGDAGGGVGGVRGLERGADSPEAGGGGRLHGDPA